MNTIRLFLMTALAVSPSLHAAETVTRVTDINPGFSGSYPCCLTIYNQQLYFRANTGLQDTELWHFDGTNAARVADIVPGTNGSPCCKYTWAICRFIAGWCAASFLT